MARDLFAAEKPATKIEKGRDLFSIENQESFEEKARRLGATPGMALTKEQIDAINRGERITQGAPQLTERPYRQVPTGEGQPFVEAAKQEASNVGAGILRAGGELLSALGIEGARRFLDELETSQAISMKQVSIVLFQSLKI